ncbi:MAG: VTT domain-containing protein [Clostridia bacterium]|nr:VTT domain-containing protein [Clostridia bacterium]
MEQQGQKPRRIVGIFILLGVLLFMGAVSYFVGRPLIRFLDRPGQFRTWVDSHGIWGRLAFVGANALQVVVALIPGEPFEVGAGYAFGFLEGTLLCMIAIVLGSAVIYLLMKLVGVRFALLFFTQEQLDSVRFLQDDEKVSIVTFLLLFIPGTPKDLLSYGAGLTKISFWRWLLIVSIARIPSVATSTLGGAHLGEQNYWASALIFGATALISLAGLLLYRRYTKNKKSF